MQRPHREAQFHKTVFVKRLTEGVTDFGIALIAQSSWQSTTQEVAGTVAYMAPEQLQGKPRRASDLQVVLHIPRTRHIPTAVG